MNSIFEYFDFILLIMPYAFIVCVVLYITFVIVDSLVRYLREKEYNKIVNEIVKGLGKS